MADDAVLSPLLLTATDQSGSLSLYGRALPYRPLQIGGRQRATFTWYPGSPAAIVQMLGPEEEPIRMNGFWKERFIALGNGLDASAYVNSEPVYSVQELVSAVDNMRRMGLKFRLQWDKLIRYGHITEFTQKWHTSNDCEWELEFTVAAQEEQAAPIVRAAPVNLTSLASQLNDLALDVAAALAVDPTFGVTDQLRALEAATSNLVTTAVNGVTNTANRTMTRVTSPLDGARAASSSLAQAIGSAATVAGRIQDTALSELAAFPGGQNAVPVGAQVAAASYVAEWATTLKRFKTYSAQARYETEKQAQQELRAAFTAQARMDFRDVSTRYYGSPDSWRELMAFNGATTSLIESGQLVWVPQRPDAPAGYGSAGSAGRPSR